MTDLFQLFPNLIAEEAAEAHGEWFTHLYYMGITVVVLLGLLYLAKQGYSGRVFKGRLAGAAEQLYLFLEQFAVGIIGPHGRKYMPMLATFWLWIFIANVIGLFVDFTPTADFSLNVGLAVTAVLYVQWEGIRANGIFGHFKHFAGPKLGGAMVLVSGMIFLIEIISEAMKMLSLSLRLYGNIHGGHEVVTNLNNLGVIHMNGGEYGIPVGGFLLPIKLLTCVVQALVFTLLLSVYLGLVTHHEDDHGHVEEPEDHHDLHSPQAGAIAV